MATVMMTLACAAAAACTLRLNSAGSLACEAALTRNSTSTLDKTTFDVSRTAAAAAIVVSSPTPVSHDATYSTPATASNQPDSLAPAPVPAAHLAQVLASPLAASTRS